MSMLWSKPLLASVHMVTAVMALSLLLCAALQLHSHARLILCAGLTVLSCMDLCLFVAQASGDDPIQAVGNGSYLLGHAVFAACLFWREELFKWLMLCLGVIYIASATVESFVVRANPAGLASNPPIIGIFLVLVFVYSQLLRFRSLSRAFQIVKDDTRVYRDLWEVTVLQDVHDGALQELEALVMAVSGPDSSARSIGFGGESVVRHRVRIPSAGRSMSTHPSTTSSDLEWANGVNLEGSTSAVSIAATPQSFGRYASLLSRSFNIGRIWETSQPAKSLDWLFSCAAIADVCFRPMIKRWALASRGYCALTNPPAQDLDSTFVNSLPNEFVLWEEVIRGGDTMLERVAWCKLKSRHRALEKLWRAYSGDVSRLVDLCRQSIVFDSPRDLLTCLQTLVADQEIRILRIKNSLQVGHDAAVTAGYRMVMVNMLLVTAETERLGVDWHVCELQLLLRDFAVLKSESGHRRYRIFRDHRAQ